MTDHIHVSMLNNVLNVVNIAIDLIIGAVFVVILLEIRKISKRFEAKFNELSSKDKDNGGSTLQG